MGLRHLARTGALALGFALVTPVLAAEPPVYAQPGTMPPVPDLRPVWTGGAQLPVTQGTIEQMRAPAAPTGVPVAAPAVAPAVAPVAMPAAAQPVYGPDPQARAAWLRECRSRMASRDNGAGGAVKGGLLGAIFGNRVAGKHHRTAGTLIGAAGGAVVGAAIDRAEDSGRNKDYCEAYLDDYYAHAQASYGYGYQGYGYQAVPAGYVQAAPMAYAQPQYVQPVHEQPRYVPVQYVQPQYAQPMAYAQQPAMAYAQPVMMVPVAQAPVQQVPVQQAQGSNCTETVVEEIVEVPVARRPARRVIHRYAPDKRVYVGDKRIRIN